MASGAPCWSSELFFSLATSSSESFFLLLDSSFNCFFKYSVSRYSSSSR
uniref:Protein translocase n=1 Tax=Rhizophora mucronata TaxID=61149 RepID=A0A2P2NK90_RHIMU